jgi:hypothetical protein
MWPVCVCLYLGMHCSHAELLEENSKYHGEPVLVGQEVYQPQIIPRIVIYFAEDIIAVY